LSSTAAAGDHVQAFIAYWKDTEGAERANFAKFAIELCRLLGVDEPEAQRDAERDRYVFEYPVTFDHPDGTSSTGRIDLYCRATARLAGARHGRWPVGSAVGRA